MPAFICPRCAHRERGAERTEGHQPRGCQRCGFGFLFEMLEDYYAGPRTALLVCDRDRRVLVAGHAAAAVTGFPERDLLGKEVLSAIRLGGLNGKDPAATALEWGVRVMGVECTFRPNGVEEDQQATVDFFPAYDADGGLMVALTPK
ncbi:MAG: hypothetical protein MUE51_09890 [Thermoleophilia bacterium]|jgi:PAS domain-containing protein|nr:hypothetical protein [Thermoleophilia bacterium]